MEGNVTSECFSYEPYHSEAVWHKTVPVFSRLSFVRARIEPSAS
jgi:hypothetical protein